MLKRAVDIGGVEMVIQEKAKKEEDALKAKEDKAVAAAEKEKVNLEKAAAKEEAKDAGRNHIVFQSVHQCSLRFHISLIQ